MGLITGLFKLVQFFLLALLFLWPSVLGYFGGFMGPGLFFNVLYVIGLVMFVWAVREWPQ